MDIDAFTCCVGPVYAGYLQRSLPVWMDTLDSLTVVTKPDDGDTIAVCSKYPRLRLVTTDVFTQHGAVFNKGAALTVAYAAMDPVDGVLHFDSDIMPEPRWRKRAEREFKEGGIHGALRYTEKGKLIVDAGAWPYGYFQFWHASDPVCQFWPIFEPWHGHCGNYDLEFLERWHPKNWRKLSFKVTHFGEVRRNWFGVGLDAKAQAEAFKKMDELHKIGLKNTRINGRDTKNRLVVPDFKLHLCFDSYDKAWCRAMLRACMTDNPFLVAAYVGAARKGWERLDMDTTPDMLAQRIAGLSTRAEANGVAYAAPGQNLAGCTDTTVAE